MLYQFSRIGLVLDVHLKILLFFWWPTYEGFLKRCHIFSSTENPRVVMVGYLCFFVPATGTEHVENPLFFLHFFQMMSSEHLTCSWLLQLLAVLVQPYLTPAGPLQPLNVSICTAKGPASYILVFTGHWSPQAFPKQYPLFRPPAQWSKLIGKKDCLEQRKWSLEIQHSFK